MVFFAVKFVALIIIWIGLAVAQKKPVPANGDNGDMGGIFGIGLSIMSSGIDPKIGLGLMTPGSETPKGADIGPTTVGSGPYEAHYLEDPTLPNHTIYVPKTPPTGIKLPVVVFGNGGCMNVGTAMRSLLIEIASHGYLAIANGPPTKGFSFDIPAGGLPKFSGSGLSGLLSGMGAIGQSKVKQMSDSIDWVLNDGAQKYGDIDKDKIVAGGQSCGGLEAYSTSYHDDRVKLTMIFNVGVFDESRRYLISELKAPVGWFMGGPHEGGYLLASAAIMPMFSMF
jgi:dienelactone hydrolase